MLCSEAVRPAHLAYTWDTVGILSYRSHVRAAVAAWLNGIDHLISTVSEFGAAVHRRGVFQAMLCCGLYLVGCCPCGQGLGS